jgi:protein-S-isoprenylcysteine O-methyltransferase Ste14
MSTEKNIRPRIDPMGVVGMLVGFLLFTLVPFLAAGRWDWWQAWASVALFVLSVVVSRVLLLIKAPDLAVERSRFARGEGAKQWDRFYMLTSGFFGPMVIWVIAGLDKRWGWSPETAAGIHLAALAVMAAGFSLGIWAMLVNRFFSAIVRIQKDRGHTVVESGPYRWVRHPAYAGGIISYLAMALMLESLWALIPAALTAVVIVVRTVREDATLQAELEGYREYTQRTRYRLLPGVW